MENKEKIFRDKTRSFFINASILTTVLFVIFGEGSLFENLFASFTLEFMLYGFIYAMIVDGDKSISELIKRNQKKEEKHYNPALYYDLFM